VIISIQAKKTRVLCCAKSVCLHRFSAHAPSKDDDPRHCWIKGKSCLSTTLIRINRCLADWAGIVCAKPPFNALLVVDVQAGKCLDVVAISKFIQADEALCLFAEPLFNPKCSRWKCCNVSSLSGIASVSFFSHECEKQRQWHHSSVATHVHSNPWANTTRNAAVVKKRVLAKP